MHDLDVLREKLKKFRAVVSFLAHRGPERQVPTAWLTKTSGRLNRRFRRDNIFYFNFTEYEGCQKVDVQGQSFFWPRNYSCGHAMNTLAELFVADHPHQYVYGKTQIAPDDIVLDIGAGEGAFAALAAAHCRAVVCVEPSAQLSAVIPQLFALRGLPAPRVEQCLLDEKAGVAHFYEDVSNPADSHRVDAPCAGSTPVPVRTLDELVEDLAQAPTFIKCDAGGAEPQIFAGGANFLRRHHPRLAITTYHNDGDYRALHERLRSYGYSVEGKGLFYTPASTRLRVQMIHAWT